MMYSNSISFFSQSLLNKFISYVDVLISSLRICILSNCNTFAIYHNFKFYFLIKYSLNKFLNHRAYLVHSVKRTNSASAVDKVTFFCNWDFHEIGLFPSKNIYPLIDLLVFSLLVKSESEYPINLLSLL